MSFYLKGGVEGGHSFFQTSRILLEAQLNPSIISRSSCSYPFLQGIYEADNFWQIYFTALNCSHPSIEVSICFCLRKSRSHPFFGGYYILTGDPAAFHSSNNSFRSDLFISKKLGSSFAFFQRHYNYFCRILAAIHYFNSTVHFSYFKICNHSLWQRTFFQSISGISHHETNFLSKQLFFQSNTD